MKKFLCMIIAVVMVLSMGVVAFAEENNATISTDLAGMTFEKGVAKEFTVTIHRGGSKEYYFGYELEFDEKLVPAKLEYYGEGGWEPATNIKAELNGNALSGRGVGSSNPDDDECTLLFRATFDKTGEASFGACLKTIYASEYKKLDGSEIRGSYSVIGSFNPTFNPAPAEDPVIIDLDGADEAETEEANPNTGALVLVPAVVALAAVTGIMVSKRK